MGGTETTHATASTRQTPSGQGMVFVLSTGRAGSMTVAVALTQSGAMLCAHEPHPQLVAESARFRYGAIGRDALAEQLRATRPSGTQPGERYGETNNRLALMVPAVRRAFPRAQLVWLVRDGRDYVSSQLQRGVFGERDTGVDNPWVRWRLRGDLAGDVEPGTWRRADAFWRLCWQWRYVNELIDRDTADLDPTRRRLLRIESLPGELPGFGDWLGLDLRGVVVPHANRRRRVQEPVEVTAPDPARLAVDSIAGWQEWSSSQQTVFEELCGPLMDRLYPGWRDEGGRWRDVPAPASAAAAPPDELQDAELQLAEYRVALQHERTGCQYFAPRATVRWQLRHGLAHQLATQAADVRARVARRWDWRRRGSARR